MFPHPASVFTEDCIASKIKQTRVSYKKALNTERQSGGDRIVATLFDICNEIWSGSNATEFIESGLESGDTRDKRNKLKKILLNL